MATVAPRPQEREMNPKPRVNVDFVRGKSWFATEEFPKRIRRVVDRNSASNF